MPNQQQTQKITKDLNKCQLCFEIITPSVGFRDVSQSIQSIWVILKQILLLPR